MRPSPTRTRPPEVGRRSAEGRPLGHRRSDWQRQTCSYGAGSGVGGKTNRRVDAGVRYGIRISVPIDQQNRSVWGNGLTERVIWYVVRDFAKSVGSEKTAPQRFEALVRPPMPCCGRRIRTDPVPARPRIGPDYRVLPRLEAEDQRCRKRQYRLRAFRLTRGGLYGSECRNDAWERDHSPTGRSPIGRRFALRDWLGRPAALSGPALPAEGRRRTATLIPAGRARTSPMR
jgi:hypothetical protein